MPNSTRTVIKNAFLSLLNEYPLSKISVRRIVEECGLNRNSFYYHFRDIPSLIEEIIKDSADALIKKYPSIGTLDEAAEADFQFTLRNKKAVLHICNSVNRSIYEQYFMQLCDYVVRAYFQTVFSDKAGTVKDEDKEIMINFTKCTMFGLYIDWIDGGMRDDAIKNLKRLIFLCHGLSDEMLERCKNAYK